MLVSALGLGLLTGLVTGGRIDRLRTFQVPWWPVLALAVVARLIAPLLDGLATASYLVAFAGIAVVGIRDRHIAGMIPIAVGALLNLLVVAMNGAMPVDPEAARLAGAVMPTDRLHSAATATTPLWILADIVPVPVIRAVYSIGDVLIAVGGGAVAFTAVRG